MVENVARTQRIQLTMIEDYENRQICTFKGAKPVKCLYICLKNELKE